MLSLAWVFVGLSLASTSSAPEDREKQLDEKRCATTYKRMLNKNRLAGVSGGPDAPYIDYNPRMLGIRGNDLLGDLYFRGCAAAGLSSDKAQAAQWYELGALNHLPESQWKLGRMLYEGDGVAKNEQAGLSWLTSSAIEGSPEAAAYLGRIGAPVPKPVTPNSYTVAAQQAKARLEAAQAAERAEVVRDLTGLLVTAATVYVAAAAASPIRVKTVRQNQAPAIQPMPLRVMTRPVYCNYYGTASASEASSLVSVHVSQFCN